MNVVSTVFFPLLTSFIVTVIMVPLSLKYIKKFGLIDDPKTHKHPAILHTKPIPRGGGIPLFIGIFIASILFLPITKMTIALFIASFISLVSGILDDKFDTSRYARLGINIVCALIIVGSGIGIPFITNPLGGIIHLDLVRFSFDLFGRHSIIVFSDILALLWIVWVMNMLNWSNGIDGQMPGILVISAAVIGILSLRFALHDPNSLISAKLSFIMAGASFGFLLFNFYPAKIFLGYGATCVYLLLSVVSILSGAKLATAILVMGVPMCDGLFTITRRVLQGRSPLWHDNQHLHHLLLKFGFGQRRIALFYWTLSAILGAIALRLSSQQKLFAIAMLGVLMAGMLIFLHFIVRNNNENNL